MSDTEGLENARKEFLGHLKTLVKEMDQEGPFFLGRVPTLIDFVIAPWVVRPSILPSDPIHPTNTSFVDAPLGLRPL